jgi:hypothetical protein
MTILTFFLPHMEPETNKGHSEVHLLPCNIHYDGPAPVESYFHPKQSSSAELTANFRGRRLVGEIVELPSNIEGTILEVISKDNVVVHSSFNQIHLWDHDLKPDARLIGESFDWFELADAVSRQCSFASVNHILCLGPFLVCDVGFVRELTSENIVYDRVALFVSCGLLEEVLKIFAIRSNIVLCGSLIDRLL